MINQGISFCSSLFSDRNYNIIFLADRWFSFREIMQHIQDIGSFYCIRTKSNICIDIGDYDLPFMVSSIADIEPRARHPRYFDNIKITSFNFTTNLVVAPLSNDDPLYVLTNVPCQKALKYYGYRFGSIECIFKSQKSNGFRLESTNTKKIEHFISLFTVMCVALCWLTIIGVDYSKNKHHYHLKIRDVKKHKNSSISREYSLFNLGLTIFNICFNSWIDFTLKFNFILYDI